MILSTVSNKFTRVTFVISFRSFSAMPGLLRSSKLAVEKGLAQGRDGTCLKKLSDYIVPALVEALHKVMVVLYI